MSADNTARYKNNYNNMANNRRTSTKQVEPTQEEQPKKITKIEGEFEMPEMEKDPNSSPYEEVYFIKPVTKDAAYFEITKKSGDQYIVNPRKDVNSLGGLLKKIETGSYTYQNEEKKTFKIHLVKEIGEGENKKQYLYIISSSYTNAGRSIINCLLDYTKPIERIHITLTAKDGFTNANVSINGVAAAWKSKTSGPGKYSREEQKEYTTPILHPKTKATISIDYTDLIDFLETELINHLKVILPNQEHRIIIPEIETTSVFDLKDDTMAIFGEDDEAGDFFEISDTDDK
jgi:hypothetical protein